MLHRALARFVAALTLAGLLAAFPLTAQAAPLSAARASVAAESGDLLAPVGSLLERLWQWLQPAGELFGAQLATKAGPAPDPYGGESAGSSPSDPTSSGLATKAGPAPDPHGGSASSSSGSDPVSGG